MLASFLMGLAGGQRAMTPLATVAIAAARDELPGDNGAPLFLANPLIAAGALALAIGEVAGDKLKSAPTRTVPVGLAARFVTSAIAGAVLAPRRQRWRSAAVGGVTAVVAAYAGAQARKSAMRRYSQASNGFVEDAAVIAVAAIVVRRFGKLAAI